ncbi:MAG: glycosyltransferase [Pyrinomonadaceae bacterium]|nr:glycosyltransferase [Pyrinomonadaceae bacterium]
MRILYVVYWGALEQLGQSLVVPAVKHLAKMGADITLVTFEKKSDLANIDEMNRVRETLENDDIEWVPLEYHKKPKLPATLYDIANGIVFGLRSRLKKNYDIVHGRTYLGGLIGVALAPLIRAKFVYHNEGFYPDEQVDGGFWKKDSRIHRIANRLDNLMYARASGIVTLSFRAKAELENRSEVREKNTPVIVVPSCVDLERFHLPVQIPEGSAQNIRLVYIGSVGGRYILDRIGEFVKVARNSGIEVSLQVFNKADQGLAREMIESSGLSPSAWRLGAVPYIEMPEQLSKYHAGLFFLTQGISEHGCSPTKIGEYWAVGLPVVTTPNVSDTDEIIRKYRVGVIVEEHSEGSYRKAIDELVELLRDPDLATRCRKAAEENYALQPACERQFELYRDLVRAA